MPTTTLFADLPLHGDVQRAIARMRFRVPSPIQLHALPLALFGNDVVGQAKSGTGKTAVFGVAAVEHAISKCQKQHQESHSGVFGVDPIDPLALILAPTREIALQIDAVVRDIARFRPACVIQTFIGGLPIAQDREKLKQDCHIAIGTPGRVKALVEQRILHCHMLRLLVLDEVDKLIQSDFENEIQYIVRALPERRQTLAFSATFTTDQLATVAQMMQNPQIVRVRGPDDVSVELVSSSLEDLSAWKQREEANENPELWLRYVKQFYSIVPSQSDSSDNPVGREANDALGMRAKVVKLTALLSEVMFNQCIVFCNDKFRAEALATALESQGWPAACITGSQSQATRSDVMRRFRSFHTRVLVSTDLTARGIDVDKVNFVVNLDLPRDPATYLHRVGRTGRFGGRISFTSSNSCCMFACEYPVTLLPKDDVVAIEMLARVFKMRVDELPEPVPREIYEFIKDKPAHRSEDVGSVVTDRSTNVTGTSSNGNTNSVKIALTSPRMRQMETRVDGEKEQTTTPESPCVRSDATRHKAEAKYVGNLEDSFEAEVNVVSPQRASLKLLSSTTTTKRREDTRVGPSHSDDSSTRGTAKRASPQYKQEEACYAKWLTFL